MSSSTQSAAEDPAFPSLMSSAGQEGSGLTTPRLESAHSLLPPAAALYAECYDWPISIVDGEVTVTCGDVLDVTTMPAGFAGEVNHLLRVSLFKVPIIELQAPEDAESSAWAFLTLPKLSTGDQLEKLATYNVTHFGIGTKFQLPPSPTCGGDGLRWRVPPPFGALTTVLPPWESVISCALQVQYKSTGC